MPKARLSAAAPLRTSRKSGRIMPAPDLRRQHRTASNNRSDRGGWYHVGQTLIGSPLWVISGPEGPKVGLPLYPRKRTPGRHRAMSESARRRHSTIHSITSSARASNVGGTVRPRALAVVRLITNSNLVDCSTGRSAGLAPLRIFPVYWPAWRYAAPMLVP